MAIDLLNIAAGLPAPLSPKGFLLPPIHIQYVPSSFLRFTVRLQERNNQQLQTLFVFFLSGILSLLSVYPTLHGIGEGHLERLL
ncbi:hypothetical protein AN958_03193 [Leucoagaricus sp. SymC.cos]|nr:hypothetical protein AN958_03193 [Leucoagaricus sp. SymC.cos]